MHRLACLALSLALFAPSAALAQERVSLAEIVPALAGTELGAIDLGEAPPAGGVRSISRTEVVAALRAAGRSADGLVIPRTTRIRRDARDLGPEELARLAASAVDDALAPCAVDELSVRGRASVAAGELHVSATGPARPETGAAVVTLLLEVGGRTTRVTAQARLTCPEPVITPGARVTVRVVSGAVRASAPGVARQRARVGDRIRVHVESTGALVEATVIDAQTVEVVR